MDVRTSAIDAFRVATLETGLPSTRWNVSASTDAFRGVSFFSRVSCRGSYWDSEDGWNARDLSAVAHPWPYPAYAGRALVDVEVSVPVGSGATIALGVENLLNT